MNPAHAALIGVSIAFVLFRLLFPTKKSEISGLTEVTEEPLEVLKKKYKKCDFALFISFVVITILSCVVLGLLLAALSIAYAQYFVPKSEERFLVTWTAYLIPAFFLGIGCSCYSQYPLFRYFYPNEFSGYQRYSDRRYGFDSVRANKFMFIILMLIGFGGVYWGLNSYVLLQSDELILSFNPLVGEEHLPLKSIKQIKTAMAIVAPNGRINHNSRSFLVIFNNGRKWTTSFLYFVEVPQEEQYNFIKLLSQRSGIPIEEVPVINEYEN